MSKYNFNLHRDQKESIFNGISKDYKYHAYDANGDSFFYKEKPYISNDEICWTEKDEEEDHPLTDLYYDAFNKLAPEERKNWAESLVTRPDEAEPVKVAPIYKEIYILEIKEDRTFNVYLDDDCEIHNKASVREHYVQEVLDVDLDTNCLEELPLLDSFMEDRYTEHEHTEQIFRVDRDAGIFYDYLDAMSYARKTYNKDPSVADYRVVCMSHEYHN